MLIFMLANSHLLPPEVEMPNVLPPLNPSFLLQQNYAQHIIEKVIIVRLNQDDKLNTDGETDHCR
jgi:hypothetical protein